MYNCFKEYEANKVIKGNVELLDSNGLIDVSDRIKLILDDSYAVVRLNGDYTVAIRKDK